MAPLGYIAGAYKTRFAPTTRSLVDLMHEALLGVTEDAGVSPDKIGCAIVANYLGGPNEGILHLNSVMAGLIPGTHLPSWRTEAACASGGVAMHQGLLALSSYDNVLVMGVERMSGVPNAALTRNIAMAGDVLLDQGEGLNFPASYALVAQRHMADHGTTTGDLDLVSLKNHRNARLNPKAHFHHKDVCPSDVEAGPVVAAPLRLFDCCPVSDGAAAVLITREAVGGRRVPIIASAVASDSISLAQRDLVTTFPAAMRAGRAAYEQAGLGPTDVDFAEVHDCFTIAEIVAMEDLGFAAPGRAVDMLRSGDTSLGGKLPVNASGGLKAGGHAIGATGVGQLCEAAMQLRGEAGGRQVEGAKVGLTHNVGGVGGTCAVHLLGGR